MVRISPLTMKTWPSNSLESQFYSLISLIKGFLEKFCAATPSNIYLWCGPIGPDRVLSCSYFQELQMVRNTVLREWRCATGIDPAWTVYNEHKATGNSAVLFS